MKVETIWCDVKRHNVTVCSLIVKYVKDDLV